MKIRHSWEERVGQHQDPKIKAEVESRKRKVELEEIEADAQLKAEDDRGVMVQEHW